VQVLDGSLGFDALLALAPAGPICTRGVRVGRTASIRVVDLHTAHAPVEIAVMPFCGWRVAAHAQTMVFGWVTVSVWLSW